MHKLVVVAAVLFACRGNAIGQAKQETGPSLLNPAAQQINDTLQAVSRASSLRVDSSFDLWAPTNGSLDTIDDKSSAHTNKASAYSLSAVRDSIISALTTAAPPARHKDLWPLNQRDIFTLVIASFSVFIAAGGGIGGGGVLVPLYASVLGFSAKYAVALSNFTIVGGALANLVFNINRRHPFKSKPLIDWDLTLVMEPATILGALIGGYFNKITPSWIASALLAVLITAITWKLVTRARITWVQESKALAADKAKAQSATPDLEQPLLEEGTSDPYAPAEQSSAVSTLPSIQTQLPVSIPSLSVAEDDEHHADHAHSPMAYSAVGSFALQRGKLDRFGSPSAAATPSAFQQVFGTTNWRDSISSPTKRSSRQTDQQRLTSLLSGEVLDEDEHQGTAQAAEEDHETLLGANEQYETRRSNNEHATSDGYATHIDSGSSLADAQQVSHARPTTPQQKELQRLLAKESKQIPVPKVSVLLLLFAGVLVTDLGKDYVRCNSLSYWAIVLSVIPLIFVITLLVRAYLVKRFRKQVASGYEWQQGDIHWSERNSIVYPAISSLAGLVAGMFGVGGGIVKGPLMLEMGVLPDVAAATSATMILFTSASASLVYLSFGGISADYAISVFVLGFLVTLAGQGSTHWLMRKLQRRSIVIIAMAGLMLLATVVMYYESIVVFLDALHHHTLTQRGYICTHRS